MQTRHGSRSLWAKRTFGSVSRLLAYHRHERWLRPMDEAARTMAAHPMSAWLGDVRAASSTKAAQAPDERLFNELVDHGTGNSRTPVNVLGAPLNGSILWRSRMVCSDGC